MAFFVTHSFLNEHLLTIGNVDIIATFFIPYIYIISEIKIGVDLEQHKTDIVCFLLQNMIYIYIHRLDLITRVIVDTYEFLL